MGVVYRARQVKLDRIVALKMILGESHANPKSLARFPDRGPGRGPAFPSELRADL